MPGSRKGVREKARETQRSGLHGECLTFSRNQVPMDRIHRQQQHTTTESTPEPKSFRRQSRQPGGTFIRMNPNYKIFAQDSVN